MIKKYSYKVDRNIPYPDWKTRGVKQNSYPFPLMKVGDSFTTGIKYKSSGESDVAIRALGNAARGWKKKANPDWNFSTAKMPDGTIRVWRIK